MKTLFFILLFFSSVAHAQKDKKWYMGMSLGNGSIYTDQGYTHNNRYVRGHFYYSSKQLKGGYQWHVVLEPEVNSSEHKDTDDYYTEINIKEYSASFGSMTRRYLSNDRWSVFFMMSTGPDYISKDSERQSKGFAFVNTMAFGITYRYDRMFIEVRPSMRHVSNGGFNKPNRGIDTYNIEVGLFIPL